jgi:hypothetical protein
VVTGITACTPDRSEIKYNETSIILGCKIFQDPLPIFCGPLTKFIFSFYIGPHIYFFPKSIIIFQDP